MYGFSQHTLSELFKICLFWTNDTRLPHGRKSCKSKATAETVFPLLCNRDLKSLTDMNKTAN